MCGFIGRINAERGMPTWSAEPMRRACAFLGKRGPDASTAWHAAGGEVELIFARLAIVDPDPRAHQPLSDPSGRLTIALNGEVYNYAELREELDGYPFRTASDTEVMLACYARWGLEGLKRLRGMFACAIVDGIAGRVHLARDPIGKKPLYVARYAQGVYFGSSVMAMAASAPAPGRVCREALEPFWRNGYVDPDRSIFADYEPVLPGHVLSFDWQGRLSARSHCVPAVTAVSVASVEEAREAVAALLRQSMVRRLHNNPAPVCLLSGGVDSTVVTQSMRALGVGQVLSLGHRWHLSPDERYARYAARRLGVPAHIVAPRLERIEDDVAALLDLQDEPLGVISFFMLALLVRTAKEYGRILLTGDGGDEAFLGYGRPADWRRTGAAPTGKSDIVVGLPAPAWMSDWGRHVVGHQMLGHMFAKLDRASAEMGVEARCPLLDWDLFAFVRSLRPEHLFHGGRGKALLKAQLDGWPNWFVERRKVGFTFHLRWLWLTRRFAGLREMVSAEAVETFGDLVPRALRCAPSRWRLADIFRHFTPAWKLMTWSRFEMRLRLAERGTALAGGHADASTQSGMRASPRSQR